MFEFNTPQKIIFGWESVRHSLAKEVKTFGKNCFLITGRNSMKKSGILSEIKKNLEENKISVSIFSEVESDPSIQTVDAATKIAKKENCDCIIGLGGGSSLDVAKAVSVMVKNNGSVREYLEKKEIEIAGLPFIAIPTTAGTGTEVTKNSVITNKEKNIKISLRSFYMIPSVAILDASLTVSLPADITASTGMDALTHAIEAYLSKSANQITDILAEKAISLIAKNLRIAVKSPDDKNARENMLLASLTAGMAFANAGLGAVHALAHPLGARFHIPHGVVNALLLPYVMEFNMSERIDKFIKIAELFDESDIEVLSEKEKAQKAVVSIHKLVQDINLPQNLNKFNVAKEDIPAIVEDTKFSGSLKYNPKILSQSDLSAILQSAL
ncbi:MAG: iron-containing alcohol dehydrogenase [Candidatus Firestonebacteria bacterium]